MYYSIDDCIIFHPTFNNNINGKAKAIINKHTKLIFSNHAFVDSYHDIYVKKKNGVYLNHHQNNCNGSEFNKQIDNKLPNSIKYLDVGNSFNQSVDNLGMNLEEIVFGRAFNQPVDNLPFSIKSLTFGHSFNHPINNIPNSIVYLSLALSKSFNNKLDDLPIGLETLIIGNGFNHDMNCLPKTLTYLKIHSKYYNDDHYNKYDLNICSLPKKLKD